MKKGISLLKLAEETGENIYALENRLAKELEEEKKVNKKKIPKKASPVVKKETGKRFPRTGQYLYLVQIRRKHPNSHIREESKQFMKQYALGIMESVRIEISKFIEANKSVKNKKEKNENGI